MDVRVGPLRRLNVEELMLSNCGVGNQKKLVGKAVGDIYQEP